MVIKQQRGVLVLSYTGTDTVFRLTEWWKRNTSLFDFSLILFGTFSHHLYHYPFDIPISSRACFLPGPHPPPTSTSLGRI